MPATIARTSTSPEAAVLVGRDTLALRRVVVALGLWHGSLHMCRVCTMSESRRATRSACCVVSSLIHVIFTRRLAAQNLSTVRPTPVWIVFAVGPRSPARFLPYLSLLRFPPLQ